MTLSSRDENDFEYTGKEVEPDERKRLALGGALPTEAGLRYRVLKNSLGQILLDPVKSVPAHEARRYESRKRLQAAESDGTQPKTLVQKAGSAAPRRKRKRLTRLAAELSSSVSSKAWQNVPADLSANLERYLYGSGEDGFR